MDGGPPTCFSTCPFSSLHPCCARLRRSSQLTEGPASWPRALSPLSEHRLPPPTPVAGLLPPARFTHFRPRWDPAEAPAYLGFPAEALPAARDRPGGRRSGAVPKGIASLSGWAARDPARGDNPEEPLSPWEVGTRGGIRPSRRPAQPWGLRVLLCPSLLAGLSLCMSASSSQSSFLPEGAPDGPDCRLVFGLPPQGPTVRCPVAACKAGAGGKGPHRRPGPPPPRSLVICVWIEASGPRSPSRVQPALPGPASDPDAWLERDEARLGRGGGVGATPTSPGRVLLFRKLESARDAETEARLSGRPVPAEPGSPVWGNQLVTLERVPES